MNGEIPLPRDGSCRKNALATRALIIGQPCQRGCLTFFPAVGKQAKQPRVPKQKPKKIPKREDGL